MPPQTGSPGDRPVGIALQIGAVALGILLGFLMWGYKADDDPLERARETIEDAADDVGDAVKDTAEDLKKKP